MTACGTAAGRDGYPLFEDDKLAFDLDGLLQEKDGAA